MKRLSVILFSLILLTPMFAQEGDRTGDRDGQRKEKMEALKIAFLTKELNLTTQESEQFWPIYNYHQQELKSLRKEMRPVKRVHEMTDQEAEAALQKRFELQRRKMQLEEETMNKLKPILGAKRILKLTRAEAKFKRKVLEKAGKRQRKGAKGERKREKKGF